MLHHGAVAQLKTASQTAHGRYMSITLAELAIYAMQRPRMSTNGGQDRQGQCNAAFSIVCILLP